MTVGDGLATLGLCGLSAAILAIVAWCWMSDRRERLRAVERLNEPTLKAKR